VRRLRVAIVGFGRLGRACAAAVEKAPDLTLAGIVRRQVGSVPAPFAGVKVTQHVRDLEAVDAALACVPPNDTAAVVAGLLQGGFPVVECAKLGEHAQSEHYGLLESLARRHRVPAVVGAGWDPGALPLVQHLFEVLIPGGHTQLGKHPGVSLHHSAALEDIPGITEVLSGEWPDAQGRPRRYVYVQLAHGADARRVRAAILSDPLFAGEATEVLQMADLTALETPEGLVLERRAVAKAGEHQSLTLDARFQAATFAAGVMIDAARALPFLSPGAHRYALGFPHMPDSGSRSSPGH
jgi:diaminopimelate dehydrogenase